MSDYNEKREKQRMEDLRKGEGTSRSITGTRDLHSYIDYDVVDKGNSKIGTLHSLWSDQSGEPTFLGVKTGWIFGKTHVVPAHGAEINEVTKIIRLPFAEDMIKGAPSYDPDLTLDERTERDIYDYYHISRTEYEELPAAAGESRTGTEELKAAGGKMRAAGEEFRAAAGESRTAGEPRFETGLQHEPSAPKVEGTEEARIPLHEEELRVGKREVEVGGVRLHKFVRTETVNQPVELQHEEVVIERVPSTEASKTAEVTGKTFAEEEVFIPLRREEVVIEKKDRIREEVRARKAREMERQQVSETIRKEDVEVEREGQEVNIRQGAEQKPK
jgi:uncharacterized protein (TIGR02271 family)